jgi:hypothetical protein
MNPALTPLAALRLAPLAVLQAASATSLGNTAATQWPHADVFGEKAKLSFRFSPRG